MDLSQTDRDNLRRSQQAINTNLIGNIIEHKPQNPITYKRVSGQTAKQDSHSKSDESKCLLNIKYVNKYYDKINNQTNNESSSRTGDESVIPEEVEEIQSSNCWLNMDQVEFDKLEWMSNKAERLHQEKLKKTTQFDREGRAVSDSNLAENTETHDVESLVNLLDSAYDPQVTYSLNVVSKIASLAHMGYYDGAFDENILEILIKNCLLRVRHQLDRSSETICQSALNCIRAILMNQIDEVLLDRMYPIFAKEIDTNMWLQTAEMYDQEFTIEMKDNECIVIDPIRALVKRTNILNRFLYLLGEGGTYQTNILDILIRIARHSPDMCQEIVSMNLIKPVLESLPKSITTQTQQNKQHIQNGARALKLLRIIVQGAYEASLSLFPTESKPIDINIMDDIIPSLEAYFYLDIHCLPPHLFKLHFETLRLMKELGRFKNFKAKVLGITALARENLHKRFKSLVSLKSTEPFGGKISMEWQHAAHLIDFIGSMISAESSREALKTNSLQTFWDLYIQPITLEWINAVVQQKIIPHLDASIAIASALSYYRAFTGERYVNNLVEIMIDAIVRDEKDRTLNVFKILAREAADKSLLVQFGKESGKIRDPAGLPSFGCLNFNTTSAYEFKLNPLFDNDSPFILLNSFVNELLQGNVNDPEKLKIFINNLELDRYIRCITSFHHYDTSYESRVQQSQIAQYEVKIIAVSLLFLGRYYLEIAEKDFVNEFDNTDIEPAILKRKRVESYSNLCYYTISLIGLFYASNSLLCDIKDQLFEKVLLNKKLHRRLTVESSMQQEKVPLTRYLNLIDCEINELTSLDLNLITPIYTSSDHLDRFWMFQPIIDYYLDEIKDNTGPKDTQKKSWFLSRVKYSVHTGELISSNDTQIVSTLMTFNETIMRLSAPYLDLSVCTNLEEYLCLIGILFLDDNLFLDKNVSRSILLNLEMILGNCLKQPKKFKIPFQDASKVIKPIELPLADFFNRLVDQFEAVSYGDLAFTNFLLLFLTPDSDKVFRRKLFQEKLETCLLQIRLTFDDLLVPRELFFSKKEEDSSMRDLLQRCGRRFEPTYFFEFYCAFHSKL